MHTVRPDQRLSRRRSAGLQQAGSAWLLSVEDSRAAGHYTDREAGLLVCCETGQAMKVSSRRTRAVDKQVKASEKL